MVDITHVHRCSGGEGLQTGTNLPCLSHLVGPYEYVSQVVVYLCGGVYFLGTYLE